MSYIQEKIMVNRRFWLAVALMLGIVVVGCVIEKKVEKTIDKIEGKEEIPSAEGKVTINGIPRKYNGDYIYLKGYTDKEDFLLGFIDVRYPGTGLDEIKLATISNGTAEVPVYVIDEDASSFSGYIKAYSGDDVFTGHIMIVSPEDDVDNNGYFIEYERVKAQEDYITSHHIREERFSEGNLTVTWPEEQD
jgi:hypothetical protein